MKPLGGCPEALKDPRGKCPGTGIHVNIKIVHHDDLINNALTLTLSHRLPLSNPKSQVKKDTRLKYCSYLVSGCFPLFVFVMFRCSPSCFCSLSFCLPHKRNTKILPPLRQRKKPRKKPRRRPRMVKILLIVKLSYTSPILMKSCLTSSISLHQRFI